MHPETIPFLYESFETALVDCFPALGLDMLNIYGAILSGSRRNVSSISPEFMSQASPVLLKKTVSIGLKNKTQSGNIHSIALDEHVGQQSARKTHNTLQVSVL